METRVDHYNSWDSHNTQRWIPVNYLEGMPTVKQRLVRSADAPAANMNIRPYTRVRYLDWAPES